LAREHLGSALVVARELGHARLESIVLCNLGLVCEAEARAADAQAHYEAALVVARRLGDRRSEGQFLSYLGLLHARQARYDAARECLALGQSLLVALSDRLSLGILLCSRAEAEHLSGATPAARAALEHATALSAEAGAGPESELGMALARARSLIDPAASH